MIKIPHLIVVNTGEQGTVQGTIDDFFVSAKHYCEEHHVMLDPGWVIRSAELNYDYLETVVSDDRVTYLSYQDKIVAGVLETRTGLNHVCYNFFLSSEYVEDKSLNNY